MQRVGEAMANVLILGANGQLARNTTRVFLRDTDARLTLYLRQAERLPNPDPSRVRSVEGDVLDRKTLEAAMAGQDVVYANLAGDMKKQAENIVAAMLATGLRRLIFISSMGIYGEVPGERYRSVLDPYRDCAAVIEASDLDYVDHSAGMVHPRREGLVPDHAEGRALQGSRRFVEQPVGSDREGWRSRQGWRAVTAWA